MKIGPWDTDSRVLVIAEIGNNHEGDSGRALELAQAACEVGADIVKFQIIRPDRLVNDAQTARREQLESFRLPADAWPHLADEVRRHGALFSASVFDPDSLREYAPLLDVIKIASGDNDYAALLLEAARTNRPVLMSSGMTDSGALRRSVEFFAQHLPHRVELRDRLGLLHCISLYPLPPEQAQLACIPALAQTFGLVVGWSDHSVGIDISLMAMACGARIIEKHFTLDKTRTTFRDHALSADPEDLRRLCLFAHAWTKILGSGEHVLSESEIEIAHAARRGMVARHPLKAGHVLTPNDVDFVRPREGLAPFDAPRVFGRVLKTDMPRHAPITLDMVI